MKLAKWLWTIASFYLLVIGIFYMFVLNEAPPSGAEKYEYVLQNWTLYDYQWKSELMMATMLSISSFLFSKYASNPGFMIIGVGQLFFAVAMPLSIGITPNASYELGSLFGKGAHQLVNFGMMVSLAGYLILHWKGGIINNGLRIAALVFAGLALLCFLAGFLNVIEPHVAQKAMILVMLLYLINGYFGIRINETNAKIL